MKTLLGTFFGILMTSSLQAQCTPGSNYADSTFGAWPDTTTNFPTGYANVAYSTDLNFKVPSNASDVDPDLFGTITDFTVDSVVGLPQGFGYSCNISNCTYSGGANGCAQLSGTSPNAGIYNITIHITANLSIFGFPVPAPYTFEGYRIQLDELAGVKVLAPEGKMIYPNPVKSELTLPGDQISGVEVFNAQGQKMQPGLTGNTLSVSTLENGMYFIRVITASGSESYSFVKE